MKTYFGTDVAASQQCEVFCIDGVPAASLLYNTTNAHGDPVVESFHLNKGLILMFDAGDYMRATLFERHPLTDARYARNRNDFLFF